MAITTQFLTGFEHGFIGTGAVAGSGLFQTILAPANWSVISGASSRHGTGRYAHFVAPASTTTYLGWGRAPTGSLVARFTIKVSSRPSSGKVMLASVTASTTEVCRLGIDSAGVLECGFGTTVVTGPTIDTTNWHLIEIQVDGNAKTVDWKVDGVLQTRAATAVASNTIDQFQLGVFPAGAVAGAYTADYDDLIFGTWTTAATDWYGDGKILSQLPGSDGTHATVPSLSLGDAGAALSGTVSTAWTMVRDFAGTGGWSATRSTTDNLALRVATVGAYLEVKPAAATEYGTANAVRALLSYSSPTATANLAACDVRNSANAIAELWGLTGGVGKDYSEITNFFKGAIVPQPVAGWTPAEINAIRMRFGGCVSADISPVPTCQALMLEVDWQLIIAPPVNQVAPALSGGVWTGETLTSTPGSWSGFPVPTFGYQWERNGSPIAGATSSTYVLAVADEGTSITCDVTATNSQGAATQGSDTLLAAAPPTMIDDFNRANGLVHVGSSLWSANRLTAAAIHALDIQTLTLRATAATDGYLVTPYPGDFNIYVDMVTVNNAGNAFYIYFCASNPGASYTGYRFNIVGTATNETWTLERIAGGAVAATLSSLQTGNTLGGSKLRLERVGSAIRVYRLLPGISWVKIIDVTDATLTSGIIGIGIPVGAGGTRIDNLRGGTFVAGPQTFPRTASDSWSVSDSAGGVYTPTPVPLLETLIDDFNRADGPVYTGKEALWSTVRTGNAATATQLRTYSNALGANVSADGLNSTDAYVLSDLADDFDILFDVVAAPGVAGTYAGFQIDFQITNPGVSVQANTFEVLRVASTIYTRFYNTALSVVKESQVAPMPTTGDTVWLAKRGNVATYYLRQGSGPFVSMLTHTYSARVKGKFGIQITEPALRIDNLRGGLLLAPATYPRTASDSVTVSDAVTQRNLDLRTTADDVNPISDAAVRAPAARTRPVADTVAVTDTAARVPSARVRPVADTVAVSDAVTRAPSTRTRTAADSVTISDTAVVTSQGVNRTATDTWSVSDVASKIVALSRTATDVTAVSDSATRTVTVTRTATDTVAISDAGVTGPTARVRSASDSVTLSDVAARTPGVRTRPVADTVALSDNAAGIRSVQRAAIDTVATSDVATAVKIVVRTATDSVVVSDTALRSAAVRTRTSSDLVTMSDSAVLGPSGRVLVAADTVAVSDVATRVVKRLQVAVDSVALSDVAVLGQASRARAASDTVATSDAAVSAPASRLRIASDTVALSDTVTRTPAVRTRTAADTFTLSDTVARTAVRPRTATDTTVLSDTAVRSGSARVRTAVDAVSFSDTAAGVVQTGAVRSASDSWTVTDVVTRAAAAKVRTATDLVTISDVGTGFIAGGLFRVASDTVAVGDSAVRAPSSRVRPATDTVALDDVANRAVSRPRVATDTVAFGDVANRVISRPRVATDTVLFSDAATRSSSSSTRAATDTVTFADVANRVSSSRIRAATDTVLFADTATRTAAPKFGTATDSITFADVANRAISSKIRTAADVLTFADVANRAISSKVRTAADSITVTDFAGLVREVLLSGNILGTSAQTGALVQISSLSGDVAGSSTLDGILGELLSLSGNIFGSSALVGDLVQEIALTGEISGVSVLTGSLIYFMPGDIVVNIDGGGIGTSTLAGVLHLVLPVKPVTFGKPTGGRVHVVTAPGQVDGKHGGEHVLRNGGGRVLKTPGGKATRS